MVSNKSLRYVTEKCLRRAFCRSTQSNSIWRTVSGCPQVLQVGWSSPANVQEGQFNIQEMTSKTDGSSVAGGMWTTTQQTWHPKAGRSTSTYVRQQPGKRGWRQLQPDGRHYQTATVGRTKRSTAKLVSDAIEWFVFMQDKTPQVRARLCTPGRRSWTELTPGRAASADRLKPCPHLRQ